MSDTLSSARVEPIVSPAAPVSRPAEASPPAVSDSVPHGTSLAPVEPAARSETGLDQLSRIEDKTARIEEKYARSEARMQRVVDKVDSAMDRFSNVALQSDLAAVRGEVGTINRRLKKLPGFGALLLTSVVSAVLTAAVIILLFKYGGGFLTPVR
jgi:hypothetical protein